MRRRSAASFLSKNHDFVAQFGHRACRWAIRLLRPRSAIAGGGELGFAGAARDFVEDAVDDAGLVLAEKGFGDLDVFADDNPSGDVGALDQLEDSGPQDSA